MTGGDWACITSIWFRITKWNNKQAYDKIENCNKTIDKTKTLRLIT